MENTGVQHKQGRRTLSQWIEDKMWESRMRGGDLEQAANSWHYFCDAITYNFPWTVSGQHLDGHHLQKYPSRYELHRVTPPLVDPEGFRARLCSLIAGQRIKKASQKDLEHTLALFTAAFVSCVGEHVVPDAPPWHRKWVLTSEIERWISDAAKATGADVRVKAYFAGVPYDDLLNKAEQKLYEKPMKIVYNNGKIWSESVVEPRN